MQERILGLRPATRGAAGLMAAVLSLPLVASASLVVDGGFETPVTAGNFTTFNVGTMGAWSVVSGSVDLIHNYWQPAGGLQSVDTAGNINGTISQMINGLTIGQAYLLTFQMAGNPDGGNKLKTLQVTFGSYTQTFTFDATGKTRSNMGWTLKSAQFVATANSMLLSFQDQTAPPGTPYGSALDNVALVPVPEASTVTAGALLLLPFGVGLLRTWRKQPVA